MEEHIGLKFLDDPLHSSAVADVLPGIGVALVRHGQTVRNWGGNLVSSERDMMGEGLIVGGRAAQSHNPGMGLGLKQMSNEVTPDKSLGAVAGAIDHLFSRMGPSLTAL